MKAKILNKNLRVHEKKDCQGEFCCIHRPSEHLLNKRPIYIRMDKFTLAERICKHGVGHPDPDSVAFIASGKKLSKLREYLSIHGCDGCCGAERIGF